VAFFTGFRRSVPRGKYEDDANDRVKQWKKRKQRRQAS
jgi:hypothetical protein